MKSVILAGLLALLSFGTARADVLNVDITSGVDAAEPVAVAPFRWEGGDDLSEDVAAIIADNLRRSGRFAPLDRDELPAVDGIDQAPDFGRWEELGADNMVVGEIRSRDDRLEIRFRVFNVYRGEQILGYSLPTRPDRLRRAAHQISDMIYEQLTGEPGAFNTRLAYVQTETRSGGGKRYHLVVSDSDGHDPRRIMSSPMPVMSPAWSPDGDRLAYVSFENRRSEIFIQNLDTGERRSVSSRDGVNGAPAFSPDGRRLAMALSAGSGGPDIHVLDLDSGDMTRVTRSRAIDTEPAWFPDGDRLAFTSDRGGAPQVYAVGTEGGRVDRLTYDGRYNARPILSPDGKRLGMIHQGANGEYRIAVRSLDRRNLTVLGEGPYDESPSFAPNGAMIIYAAREGNRSHLATVSTDGRVRQTLGRRNVDVRDPAWSPRLDRVDRSGMRE